MTINVIKKIGSCPRFVLSYEDRNGRMYKIEDDAISDKAVPGVYLNGNPYDTSYYSKNQNSIMYGRGSDVLNFMEPFFGNGNDCYSPMVHSPYVFKITYSNGVHVNHAHDYSESFLKAIEENNLSNCDVIGKSFGGLIALEALKKSLVNNNPKQLIDHVYGLNVPIYGSPLADAESLEEELLKTKTALRNLILKVDDNSILKQKGLFYNLKRLLVIRSSLATIAPDFGSTSDNAFGIELPADKTKFTILEGTINHLSSKNIGELLMRFAAEYIESVSLMESDGCVIVDKDRMKMEGIEFIEMDCAHHSNLSNERYMRCGYEKILAHKGITIKS